MCILKTSKNIHVLLENFCFRFSRSQKAIKRRWARFGPFFAVVNIIKMIFVIKLRLHERRRSPAIIWLFLWFSSFCFSEISQIFTIFKICPADPLKPKKLRIAKAVSSLCTILCFLPLSQIWSYEFFLPTGTKKGTNMFNGPANLRKFHRRKRDKSCSKDPYFLYRKTSCNGKKLVKIYISMCVNFRISRLLTIFLRCFLSGWPLYQA